MGKVWRKKGIKRESLCEHPALVWGVEYRLVAEAAFDAQAVYDYFVGSASTLAIPLNLRGKPRFQHNANRDVRCPTAPRGTPLNAGKNVVKRANVFVAPLVDMSTNSSLRWLISTRWLIAHDGPTFRRLYRQRTVVAPVNPLAGSSKFTRPRQRRLRSVARRSTLLYLVLNYRVLLRLPRHHQVPGPLFILPPLISFFLGISNKGKL